MDALLKAIAEVVPFVNRCPAWFQVTFVAWVACTAFLLIAALVLALRQPPQVGPAPTSTSTPSSTASPGATVEGAPIVAIRFAIVRPQEGTVVEAGDTVEFVSPHTALNHYVVVTPLQTPTRWVVDGPLTVTAGESQHGIARFGNSLAGRGERFSIQILATKDQIKHGVLDQPLFEPKFSTAVKVIRAR